MLTGSTSLKASILPSSTAYILTGSTQLQAIESLLQQLLSDGREDHPLFTRAAPSDPAVLFLRTHAETLRAIRTLNDPKGIYLTCPLRLERR